MARVVSLIVAVVTALAGHGLLFDAAFSLQRASSGAAGVALPFFVAPFAVVGVLLIGAAALTAAWSSLGVIVVGAVQAIVGLGAVVLPTAPGAAGSLRTPVDRAVLQLGPIGQVADFWATAGLTLVEGALLLTLGWVTARRRRGVVARPGVARVVSLLVMLVGLGPAIALALHGGYRDEQRLLVRLAGPDVLGLVLLAVGLILLVALTVASRWSGLGSIVWGAVVLGASQAAVLTSALLPRTVSRGAVDPMAIAARGLPPELASAVLVGAIGGGIAVVGAIFLFGGIASAIAGRTGHRRATWVQPATGEAPQVVPSTSPARREA